MIIKIDLGTDIQVRVHLMKGEYDNKLQFPFKGKVTVTLLNQLYDANHIQISNVISDELLSFNTKVVDNDIGYFPMADMSFSAVQLTRTTDKQYIVNDASIFRVSVEVPSFKPWLCCTDT